jgi:hypothetical protein
MFDDLETLSCFFIDKHIPHCGNVQLIDTPKLNKSTLLINDHEP